jgi:Zn-dependent peptidase ImmA (M78 family)/DNA-binding XRE family transcriptional regulator
MAKDSRNSGRGTLGNEARTVNPDLIALAREARGMTQTQLAASSSISQPVISKIENGAYEVDADRLLAIAEALGYPPEFFYQSGRLGWTVCMADRKRKTMPLKRLHAIHAQVNIARMQVMRLLNGVEIDPALDFPRLDVLEFESPEEIARLARAHWRLPFGPLRSVIDTVESAGGIVIRTQFASEKIDAVSLWVPGSPPFFFMNETIPGDRWRWSLTHELGHAIMHATPTPDQEKEADRFASEFLMPADEIRPELEHLTMAKLADLKERWRVSMQALIRRAYQVGAITERQQRSFFMRMSQMGYRKSEPFPFPQEEPTLLQQVLTVHLGQHGYTPSELSQATLMLEDEFRATYLGGDPSRHLHAVS